MRLGEIKSILDNCLNEDNGLYLDVESVYAGQAHKVKNYGYLAEAIDVIKDQSWNDVDFTEVETVLKKFRKSRSQTLDAEDYNKLNSYVSRVNKHLPYYYSILEELVEEQDEKTLNIKLPSKPVSFNDLAKQNKELDSMFDMFNIDGGFEFKAVDMGSVWYIVIPVGAASYPVFIGCLKIAQEILKTRKEYYESEKARIDYEASLEASKNFTEAGLKKYCERRESVEIRVKIEKLIETLSSLNGNTNKELQSKLVKGIASLIKQLDKGTEIHLSLNPPKFASEDNGQITIDYEEMKKLGQEIAELNKKKEEPKQISQQKKKEDEKSGEKKAN